MSAKRREKSLIQLENQLKTLQATLLLAAEAADSSQPTDLKNPRDSAKLRCDTHSKNVILTKKEENDAFEEVIYWNRLPKGQFALFAPDNDTITELQEEYNKIIFKKHKVWSRSFVIPKTFVGISFQVHNGTKFQDILITEEIVGYRFGEFVPTRKVTVHKQAKG